MKTKNKPCSHCSKESVIFKSLSIEGKQIKLCKFCWDKYKTKLVKQKATEKKKVALQKKRETITEAKLDKIFSLLVRNIYPAYCHSCMIPLEPKQLHCCHFVSRTKRCFRWDLRNCLPGCPTCNLYVPEHVWELGKSINKYYGEDVATELVKASKIEVCKLSAQDRNRLYDIFSNTLKTLETIKQSSLDNKNSDVIHALRNEVIRDTSFVKF